MLKNSFMEIFTGLLTILFICYIAFFAIGDFSNFHRKSCFAISAKFSDVGGLKIGSSVTLFGVEIGRVKDISLDIKEYSANVDLCLDKDFLLPSDSILKVEDKTVLGDRKISILLGVDTKSTLKNGQYIDRTQVSPSVSSVITSIVSHFIGN